LRRSLRLLTVDRNLAAGDRLHTRAVSRLLCTSLKEGSDRLLRSVTPVDFRWRELVVCVDLRQPRRSDGPVRLLAALGAVHV
jgi:hypothetical protein